MALLPAQAGSGLTVFAIALVVAITVAGPTEASIQMSPVTQEVLISAGGSDSGTWSVKNSSAKTVEVAVNAVSFEDYLRGNRDALAPTWITLTPDRVTLFAGEDTTIAFTVNIPDSMTGERMLMVFFAEQPSGNGAVVQGRIGTAFYVMISGTLHPLLELVSIRHSRDIHGRSYFFLELKNPGNVHLRPRGEFVIYDSMGHESGRTRLEIGMPVLAGGRERFASLPVVATLLPGDYVVRYRIESGIVDDKSGPFLLGEIPFTIVP